MTDPAPSVQPVRAWAVVDDDGLTVSSLEIRKDKDEADYFAWLYDKRFPSRAPHRVIRVEIREVNDE